MKIELPQTVEEACFLLGQGEQPPVPIAGATDLFVHWSSRPGAHDGHFLDLSHIDSMRSLVWTDDECVLGGLVTYWDVQQDPLARDELMVLVDAARTVGAIQIQARGTWAGNIVNASPAADGVPALMACDAVVRLQSGSGTRDVRLDQFYTGYKQMRMRADELIVEIRLPRRRLDVSRFVKVGSRRAQAITKVGVAITRSCAGWRVVANSVAPTVRRMPAVESMLEQRAAISRPEDLLDAIRADVSPIDDIRSTARYRETVLARVLFHEFASCCDWLAPGGRP